MSAPQPSVSDERRDWNYDAPDRDGVEYLNDEQVAIEPFDNDLAKKDQASVNVPYAGDEFEDPVQARIRRMDEERAATVHKRRANENTFQKVFSTFLPYGGIVSSGFSLASACIGAGIISLPAAFNACGIVMALIYLIVVGLLTWYSITLLARAADRTGLRNYEEIVRELMGPLGAYTLCFCLWFLSFGAEISYTLSLGTALAEFLDNSDSVPDYLHTKPGKRLITAMLWLVFMLPLCIPKEINSLRYFSFLAIMFIVFFVICMIIHFGQTMHSTGLRNDYVILGKGNAAIDGLGIFMFSFISQLNMMEIYAEQYKPSVKRMTQTGFVGTGLCFILYLCAGLFGYLDFGAHMPDSSLKLYNPMKQPLFAVAYVGIMFKLCVGYGMHMIPVRDATYFVMRTNVHKVPYWLNTIVVVTYAVISLVAGMFIPRVTVVFGLVGSFAGSFIGYIFPALMYMYTGNWNIRSVGWFDYFGTYMLLIVGVIGLVFGTASTILAEVNAI